MRFYQDILNNSQLTGSFDVKLHSLQLLHYEDIFIIKLNSSLLLEEFLFWIPMELKLYTHVQRNQLKNVKKLRIMSICITDPIKWI